MIRRAGLPALAAVSIVVLLSACGGGSGTTTVVRTVAPRSAVARPSFTSTGAPEVDQVVGAALLSQDIELAGLTGYQHPACTTASPVPGGPPACRDNESDGTAVEALPRSKCENGWVRPEQVPDAFREALAGERTLVAAFRPATPPGLYGDGFGAGYVVVLRTGAHADGNAAGVGLHIKDGRVVWIESDCANLFELMMPERVASFIIDPKGTPGAVPTTAPPVEAPTEAPPPGDVPAEAPTEEPPPPAAD